MVLISELSDDVLHLTLNRPERYNAVNSELRDALLGALRDAPDQGARAIVLRGTGKGFCAGVDLKGDTMSSDEDRSGYRTESTMRTSSHVLVRAFLECPLPIVAGVHGTVAGLGLALAFGADVCIAADDARFAVSFVHRSLVPDSAVARLLPRIVGYARAREIIMLGRTVEAPEAQEIGITARLVPADQLDEAIRATGREFAQLPTVALCYAKKLLTRGYELDLETFLFEERTLQGLASTTKDYGEGVQAFLERREPRFGGK
jgi:2-(1,2-epoxy-1,2-dihydrophenyl)acetyl-CoA isomerase